MRSLHDYLTGGPVRGPGTPTSDSILARLSNGEYVLPKVAVDQVGVQNLEAIRRAALAKTPKLALGGPISGGLNFQSEQEPTSTTFYPSGLPTASAPSFGDAIGGTNTGIKLGGSPAATPPGSLNSYGNDMSLANRMNAGAEAMRTMREGSAAPPAKPADDFATTLAKALQANDPAKQADEARKAAQAKADPLDVASGRFDREYAPGMAAGGLISQAQWERLPRFANGTPADYPGYFSGERGKSVYDFLIGVPKAEQQRREIANAPPANAPPAVPVNSAATFNMMDGKRIVPPAPPPFAGQGDPLAGRLPDVSGLTGYTASQGPAPAPLPTTPGPGASGYENRGGVYRKVELAPGFGPNNPNRVPAPGQTAGTTQYVVPGATGVGGGPGQATFHGRPKSGGFLGYAGTPETAGMTQAEATAYNVANLNRQYEAVKSRNEAYGWGGTAGSALPAAPASVDMWARPGDSFGDSQMRQARYEGLLKDAANQKGLGAKRRAAAMIDAATGLLAPGAATAKLNAEQQQAANSLTGQLAQARAQQEASKYGADVGLAGHKYTADATLAGSRLKAEQEAQQSKTKNDIDLANAMSARISATARNALPAEKQMLLQLVDAYSKLDPKSAEGQRLKLLIDALNPPKDQASLVDEIAKLKAQESQ